MHCWFQWPRGLRRRSLAVGLLRLRVRILPGAWMFVCCECCVLSGRGLCDGLITHPEESYRLWRVVVCDQETSNTRMLKHATGLWKYITVGCNARETNNKHINALCSYRMQLKKLCFSASGCACSPCLTNYASCRSYRVSAPGAQFRLRVLAE
jgi:hypothetical protein